MSNTGLVLDDMFTRHDTGPGHPERPERVTAVQEALASAGLAEHCYRVEPEPAKLSWILSTHSKHYVQRLEEKCHTGKSLIDCADSAICPESYEVARHAVGAVLNAVDGVAFGNLKNAFCAVRPPGHHAEKDMSMGFCLFNNIAIAANYLITDHGVQRLAILDWDVHHGNGTQHAFETDPRVFFCSIHGHPDTLYPGSGYENERGDGPGAGTTLNIPVQPGAVDADYQTAILESFVPAVRMFNPEFMLVSAGFDAHRADPLAHVNLETSGFEWMTQQVVALADQFCAGRLVTVLEGGYDLQALGECAVAHLSTLLKA